jgi:sigma-B regulation protein RsbU (phosphoserine phosphatase)
MDTGIAQSPQDGLPLEQQVARLQALLEATRQVHSTMQVNEVLMRTACILVRELEMEGALFLSPTAPAPVVLWGSVPEPPYENCPRYPLLSKEGRLLAELIVATPANGEVSLYEQDFIEGLVLQNAIWSGYEYSRISMRRAPFRARSCPAACVTLLILL